MNRRSSDQAATRAVLDAYALKVKALEARLKMARRDRDRLIRGLIDQAGAIYR